MGLGVLSAAECRAKARKAAAKAKAKTVAAEKLRWQTAARDWRHRAAMAEAQETLERALLG